MKMCLFDGTFSEPKVGRRMYSPPDRPTGIAVCCRLGLSGNHCRNKNTKVSEQCSWDLAAFYFLDTLEDAIAASREARVLARLLTWTKHFSEVLRPSEFSKLAPVVISSRKCRTGDVMTRRSSAVMPHPGKLSVHRRQGNL